MKMKKRVFVDTGFWIALVDKRDQNHTIAKQSLKSLLNGCKICLSDFIIFETLTYLNCSLKRHDLAMLYLNKTESPGVHVFTVDETTKDKVIQKFKRYTDKDLSVTDCTSFVIMNANSSANAKDLLEAVEEIRARKNLVQHELIDAP